MLMHHIADIHRVAGTALGSEEQHLALQRRLPSRGPEALAGGPVGGREGVVQRARHAQRVVVAPE